MNKDRFESELGRQLRDHQASVPMGSWNVIQARLQVQGAAGNSGGFGFGAGLTVGVGLLLGLAAYSALETQSENNQSGNAYANTAAATVSDASNFQTESEATETVIFEENPEKGLVQESDNIVVASKYEVPDVSSAEISTINANGSDAVGVVQPNPSLTAAEVKPAAEVSVSEQAGESAPQILSGGMPDDIATMEAPFAAAIRTSGSFGYAPFIVDFETVGNPSGQVWDFGPYGKSTDSHPTVVFDKPGLYSVMLSAYRGENEQKIEFVTIEVEEGSSLYMPNSFSPDGDGQNDVFLAKGTKLQTFQLTIVNSKGGVVFQSLDIDTPWVFDHAVHGQDGEFYIAIVRAKGLDNKEYNIRQRLNIIY